MQAEWKKEKLIYEGSKNFRELLGLMMKKRVRLGKDADYEDPNWHFKQAHDNGYNQALKEILTLIGEK